MPTLYLTYQTTSTGGEFEDPSEAYGRRRDIHLEVSFLGLYRTVVAGAEPVEISRPVAESDTVHVVVARYLSSDSYGVTHGNWSVYGAYFTEAEASGAAENLLAHRIPPKTYVEWREKDLERVEIHRFPVREAPLGGQKEKVRFFFHP
jgi:hypothetical protein